MVSSCARISPSLTVSPAATFREMTSPADRKLRVVNSGGTTTPVAPTREFCSAARSGSMVGAGGVELQAATIAAAMTTERTVVVLMRGLIRLNFYKCRHTPAQRSGKLIQFNDDRVIHACAFGGFGRD